MVEWQFVGSSQWSNQTENDFLTSAGNTRANGNHTRANWVSIHGLVDGDWCGAAVLCHPDSFRSPQQVRLHPFMPYFVFSPPVDGSF